MRPRSLRLAFVLACAAGRAASAADFSADFGQAARPVTVKGWVKNPPPGAPGAVDFSAYKGRVVLLERWATWCGPCVAKIPALIDLQAKYKDDLALVSLSEEEAEKVRSYFKKTTLKKLDPSRPDTPLEEAVNYSAAVMDPKDPSIDVYFGFLRGVPSFYVIGRDGRIARAVVGSYDEVLREVERLLSASGPTAAEQKDARESTSIEKEKGRLTKEVTKLGSPSDPAARAAGAVKHLRLAEIAERSLARRPWEFDARDDRLRALESAWHLSEAAERPALRRRIAAARDELFAFNASTRTYPLSWSQFAEMVLPGDYALMDPPLALKAIERAQNPAKASDGDRVWDMVHMTTARVYLMNGRPVEAAAWAEKALKEVHPVRRGYLTARAEYHRALAAMAGDLAGVRAEGRKRLASDAAAAKALSGGRAARLEL
ncbi:MAG: redoxin domain-containing protein, partial [Elusimicrobia bacterium]